RDVQGTTRRCDVDVGDVAGPTPPGGKCRLPLEHGELAALGLEAERRHGGVQLVRDVHERQLRVKGEVAGTRAGAKACVAAFDVLQRSVVDVETIHENTIDAEVRGQGEAVGRIGHYAMRVRRFLPLLVRSSAVVL